MLRFDAAFEDVKPCLACDYCASHDGQCIREDAMNKWCENLIDSDMIGKRIYSNSIKGYEYTRTGIYCANKGN